MPEPRSINVADPGPLGLAAFALTTFVLSIANAGILPAAGAPLFLTLAFFYGGLVQTVAGCFEFFNKNTFGALVFSSFGGFWLSLAFLVLLEMLGVINFGAAAGTALGWWLIAWAIFALYLLFATFKLNGAFTFTFVVLEITFILLIIGNLTGSTAATHWGGYAGILLAACAWYISAAGVLNGVTGRTVLPLFPYRTMAA